MSSSYLASEWTTLQNQFDSYEKYSLLIKLSNIFIFCAGLFTSTSSIYLVIIISALWLQDAIWKTFQGRIEERLLFIESMMSNDTLDDKNTHAAFQFNSQFSENRKQGNMLIKEYLKQMLRPTVAFPHIILLLAQVILFV
jgi:hypothetical protein